MLPDIPDPMVPLRAFGRWSWRGTKWAAKIQIPDLWAGIIVGVMLSYFSLLIDLTHYIVADDAATIGHAVNSAIIGGVCSAVAGGPLGNRGFARTFVTTIVLAIAAWLAGLAVVWVIVGHHV